MFKKTNADVAFMILEKIDQNGEMTAFEISRMLRRIHRDHRDFYPWASLMTSGWVEDYQLKKDSLKENPPYKDWKTQTLAWKLCAISDADSKAKYKNNEYSIHGGEKFRDQLYALTGAGYLRLYEIRDSRRAKFFTVLMAVFSALLGSFLTVYVTKQ